MSLKTRLAKLESRIGKTVLVVVDTDETNEQALHRWCNERQQPRPERVIFICTGVPRGEQ